MNKLLQIVPATILSAAFVGSIASAQAPNCDVLVINGTGPGSTNEVVCDVDIDVTAVCENNVYMLDSNSQNAVSGAASSQGNVTSDTAISGNATNENGQTIELGASCETVASVNETAPEAPGNGGGRGSFMPESLPNTSGDTIIPFVIAGLIGIVSAVILRLIATAHAHFLAK